MQVVLDEALTMADDKGSIESSSPNDGTVKPASSSKPSDVGPSLAFVAGPGSAAPLLKPPIEPLPNRPPLLRLVPKQPVTPLLLRPLGPIAAALGRLGRS